MKPSKTDDDLIAREEDAAITAENLKIEASKTASAEDKEADDALYELKHSPKPPPF